MYDLRAATKRREGCKGEEEREGRRGRHEPMARGGHGLLQVSLLPTMCYPCTTCGQPPREGKGAKWKMKGKGGGEGMGIWQGVAMDYFKYRYGLPCVTHVRPAGSHQEKGRVQRGKGKEREEGKARVAARKASGLRPSYYPIGYPMMYASEEEEKGRVKKGKGKERKGKAWAYGEGWLWTP
jgi:hypothetical protein